MDGLVDVVGDEEDCHAEAWFLGDELTLLRQLGLPVTRHTLEGLGP